MMHRGGKMAIVNEYQRIADATLHILCGGSHGSGFHFLQPEIIVTNDHVVDDARTSATAETEAGDPLTLDYLTHSPRDEFDFALYRVSGNIPAGRTVLEPDESATPLPRGAEVLFAGFPHGVHELLVQRAIVSGLYEEDLGFYLDGPVNGGNSGGPVVSVETGKVVGITTASRYMTDDEWERLASEAQQLEAHCAALADPRQTGGATSMVGIQGIDFREFAEMVARSNRLIRRMLEANANTGLGIGFNIDHVLERCRAGGLA
jgi:S1-C subfamily serine protease